jgi:hypothetical protein
MEISFVVIIVVDGVENGNTGVAVIEATVVVANFI